MVFLSPSEGSLLVGIIRNALSSYLSGGRITLPENVPSKFMVRKGVFVGYEYIVEECGIRGRVSRGRQGTPFPSEHLVKLAINTAINLAVNDPRFPPLSFLDLNSIVIEVSIITGIKSVKATSPEELLSCLEISKSKGAKYGLMIEKRLVKEILLPQIIVEYGWDAQRALEQICFKAGLPLDAWKYPDVKIYTLETQVFYELEPKGEVIERKLFFEKGED
ncbi:MAG: TIGR00296 family protein [Thermoprotei archaeon]|nr:MAG: TIGR00296 family protein [Thermoprotei archaeon]